MQPLARWSIALAATCVAVSSGAQQVPVRDFVKPDAEFPEAFTNLTSMRELPGGRVLVLESCEHLVKMADFAGGELTTVGRRGDGPEEYESPSRILPLPGDSSLILDPSQRRMLMVHPDGSIGRLVRMPDETFAFATNGNRHNVSFTPSAADATGRLYGRVRGLIPTPAGLGLADSAPLERWDGAGERRDTVAFVPQTLPKNGNRSVTAVLLAPVPFTTDVQWAVDGTGRVALVAPHDYHVTFIEPDGARREGLPIPFDPVRVSNAHRAAWREAQGPSCPLPASSTIRGPDGKSYTISPRATPEPKEWPATLPPFLNGAAQCAPDGILWVQRTTPADDAPLFDLIDRSGRVIQQVRLAKRSKLLGFGDGTMYVLRIDDDDLQYLQRYALPKFKAIVP